MAGERKYDGKARACKDGLKYDSIIRLKCIMVVFDQRNLFKMLVFSIESACIGIYDLATYPSP